MGLGRGAREPSPSSNGMEFEGGDLALPSWESLRGDMSPFIEDLRPVDPAEGPACCGDGAEPTKKAGPVTGPGEKRCQAVATTVGTTLLSLTVKPATRLPKMTGPLNASKAGERTG